MSLTEQRRKERQQQAKRRRFNTVGIGLISLLIFLGLILYFVFAPADAPVPADSVSRYEGLQQSRSVEGYPILGSASNLPVAVICTYDSEACAQFHTEIIDELVTRVRENKISLSYLPYYQQIGNSLGASRSAICAAEQNAFWPLNDAFYAWRTQFGEIQAFNNNRILTGVGQLMNRGTFEGCIRSSHPADVQGVMANYLRNLVGFGEMPAVTINGVVLVDENNVRVTAPDAVLAAIDEAVAQREEARNSRLERTPEPTEEAAEAATETATEEAVDAVTEEATIAPTRRIPTAQPTVEPTEDATAES